MEIAALLDPNGIPAELFTQPAVLAHLTERTGREVTGAQVARALSRLDRLSLLTYEPEAPATAVRVHALVQRATQEGIGTKRREDIARTAADALVEAWPEIERDGGLVGVLRGNALALQAGADAALWRPNAHIVLFRTGRSLGEAGQVGAALGYFDQILQTSQQQMGPDHPDTLAARGNLAYWRGEAGDTAGVEPDGPALTRGRDSGYEADVDLRETRPH
ncbi:tetratricopeptide repeat protein [Crossiella sp. NPDC003009]